MKFTVDELRPLAIFEGLSNDQLAWFCEHGAKLELEAGDRMLEIGQPADFMFVVVTGSIEGCLRCLLLVICMYPLVEKALMAILRRSWGDQR